MTDFAILETVIQQEWAMFGAVQNIGGRAPCQDDHRTFHIMRHSQLSTWSTETLESFRSDLRTAALHGINLLERKYAYMMRDSDPVYYEKHLAPQLPAVTSAREALVRRIALIYDAWHRQVCARFPRFAACGHPPAESAPPGTVSSDAYLRGELLSYSDETRAHLLSMVLTAQSAGRNLVEETYGNIAEWYGWPSLAAAEAALGTEGAVCYE